MLKRVTSYCLAIMLCFISGQAQTTPTAQSVLAKSASLLTSGKGISADFEMKVGANTISGKVKGLGEKFAVESGAVKIWYNGRDMWTYNPRTSETTLTKPTTEELAESNPFMFVKMNTNNYTPQFSKTKDTATYVIELLPKSKRSDYKSITVYVDKNTYAPKQIKAIPASGSPITINIRNLKSNQTFQSLDFTYPSSSYPNSELIDLR